MKMKLLRNLFINEFCLTNFVNLDRDEKELIRRWRNSEKIRQWSYSDHVISQEEHSAFIEKLSEDTNNYYWLVQDSDANNKNIGVISLNKIDYENKNAFLGIYTNPGIKSPGMGNLLMACLKELAFNILNINYLKLEVIEGNVKAIDFYRQSGFKEISKSIGHASKNGKSHNIIIMEIERDKV